MQWLHNGRCRTASQSRKQIQFNLCNTMYFYDLHDEETVSIFAEKHALAGYFFMILNNTAQHFIPQWRSHDVCSPSRANNIVSFTG